MTLRSRASVSSMTAKDKAYQKEARARYKARMELEEKLKKIALPHTFPLKVANGFIILGLLWIVGLAIFMFGFAGINLTPGSLDIYVYILFASPGAALSVVALAVRSIIRSKHRRDREKTYLEDATLKQ